MNGDSPAQPQKPAPPPASAPKEAVGSALGDSPGDSPRVIKLVMPEGGAVSVARSLRDAVVRGDYARNERIPPERELARAFGVSRNTVRQALQQLEKEHLIIRRTGSGTYVNIKADTDPRALMTEVSESTSPLELFDVRMTVEPQLVQMAILNASSRDIDEIERCLVRMENAGADRRDFSAADEAFHMSIAQATQNPLFIWLYSAVNDVRGHALWMKMRDAVLSPKEIAAYNAEHRKLWEAIAERNADAGKALMRRHLDHVRRNLTGAGAEG